MVVGLFFLLIFFFGFFWSSSSSLFLFFPPFNSLFYSHLFYFFIPFLFFLVLPFLLCNLYPQQKDALTACLRGACARWLIEGVVDQLVRNKSIVFLFLNFFVKKINFFAVNFF